MQKMLFGRWMERMFVEFAYELNMPPVRNAQSHGIVEVVLVVGVHHDMTLPHDVRHLIRMIVVSHAMNGATIHTIAHALEVVDTVEAAKGLSLVRVLESADGATVAVQADQGLAVEPVHPDVVHHAVAGRIEEVILHPGHFHGLVLQIKSDAKTCIL